MPFSLESLQQRWRHECRRVDGVPVARRCTVRRCWICSVRCCLCSQLSHGSATSTTAGSAVIIMNGRVSARMVANTLRFTVRSCKIACDVGSAGHDSSASERIRLWQDPSESRPQRRMRGPIAQKQHPPPAASHNSQRHCQGSLRPGTRRRKTKVAKRDGLRVTRKPRAIGDGQPTAASPPAAPPNKGSLSRADGRPKKDPLTTTPP